MTYLVVLGAVALLLYALSVILEKYQYIQEYEATEVPLSEFQLKLHELQNMVPDDLLETYLEQQREAIFLYRKGFATKEQTLLRLKEWIRSCT